MRYIILFLLVSFLTIAPAIGAKSTDFESFIKSREVVATLYFQANSDNLSDIEHNRILKSMDQLRKLQKEGRMIRVEGFSSPEGNQETNFQLSFFRARAVADLISARGLLAEVALTGYGDLQANSTDAVKERRVEIASYLKPVGLKPVKIVDKKLGTKPSPDTNSAPLQEPVIDSFSVDQALKRKLDDRNKNLVDKKRQLDQAESPGISKKRQLDQDDSPGISKTPSIEEPIIDALTIEQAIMEKIGAVQPKPSGAVSQVDIDYR